MAYNVNHSDVANYGSLIVEDKTLNNDTSLSLIGRFYPGYAKYVSENFLHLLENFASNNSPLNPTRGQLWYDTDSTSAIPIPRLMMWNGTAWLPVGLVSRSVSEPPVSSRVDGDLWVNPETHKLSMWKSNPDNQGSGAGDWVPFLSSLEDSTGIITTQIDGNNVIIAKVGNQEVAIFSGNRIQNTTRGSFGEYIEKGINIPTSHVFAGTADKASAITDGTNTASYSKLFIKDTTNQTSGKIEIYNDNGITVQGSAVGLASSKYVSLKPTPNYIDITSNTDIRIVSNNTMSPSTSVLISSASISVNKPVNITNGSLTLSNGNISATNFTASGAITGASALIGNKIKIQDTNFNGILPTTDLVADLGKDSNRWNTIFARSLYASFVGTPDTQYTGKLSNSVTFNNNAILHGNTTFNISGDVQGSVVPGNNTSVNIETTLKSTAITSKTPITAVDLRTTTDTHHVLLEGSGGLQSITVTELAKSTTLIGSIIMYAGANVPQYYLLCNGASYSSTGTYKKLFEVIGITFGGTGTTFNVPTVTHSNTNIKYYIYAGI